MQVLQLAKSIIITYQNLRWFTDAFAKEMRGGKDEFKKKYNEVRKLQVGRGTKEHQFIISQFLAQYGIL